MKLSTRCHADSLWAMLSTQQMAALNAANCEVAFDNRTRQLYATDASPYQIVPQAVAFPKNRKAGGAHHPGGAGGGHCR